MEFVKMGKKYLIKGTGRVVTEKEKLQLENKDLVIQDIKSSKCQGKTTQKISKNKKRIKEIEKEEQKLEDDIVLKEEEIKALQEEVQNDTIEETSEVI